MADFAPIQRSSVADQVASQLRDAILSGRFRPGDHLPAERELAAQLGTNRTTLREAVRSLEALGLVRARQGDGLRVLDHRRDGELSLLPFFLSVEGASPAERLTALRDALRLRSLVLTDAAALVATRATDADLDALDASFDRVRSAAERSPGALFEADLDFYRTLVEGAHSLVVVWTFNTFARTFVELCSRMPALWVRPPRYLETLALVVEAIRARDGGAARAAIEDHLRQGDALLGTDAERTPAEEVP